MPGFPLHNQRNVDGIGFVRALGTLLTSHIKWFDPMIREIVKASLEESLAPDTTGEGER
jgi:hypothetical protein